MRKAIALVAGLAVLAFVNFGIYQRERLLTEGRVVLLEAGPGRPALADAGRLYAAQLRGSPTRPSRSSAGSSLADGHIVVAVDGTGVGHFRRLADGRPLAPGEIALRYRIRGGEPNFATNAYFFEEGQARRLCRGGLWRVPGRRATAR